MKKVIITSVIIVLALTTVGYFSINYVFDKVVGNQILSQLELEISYDDFIDNETDNELQNETEDNQEVDKEKNEKGNSDEDNKKVSLADKNFGKTKEFNNAQLKEIQEEFATRDKLKVMGMITNKLSVDEIKDLSSVASDGVDKEELTNIKEVLKEKLNQNDIEYLKVIYKKYNQ